MINNIIDIRIKTNIDFKNRRTKYKAAERDRNDLVNLCFDDMASLCVQRGRSCLSHSAETEILSFKMVVGTGSEAVDRCCHKMLWCGFPFSGDEL